MHSSAVTYGTCLRFLEVRSSCVDLIVVDMLSLPLPLLLPRRQLFPRPHLCIHCRNAGSQSPLNAKVWCVGLSSYTITSPQSTRFGRHLLVSSSPSMLLGTVTSTGLYRYHDFNAAAAARVRASSSELPAPSPSLSCPLYTPTTKTGCLLNRPVSEIRRATGDWKPSLAHSRERSRVGVRKSKRVLTSRCLLRKWSRKNRLTSGAPR
jgi:hypothetical protein